MASEQKLKNRKRRSGVSPQCWISDLKQHQMQGEGKGGSSEEELFKCTLMGVVVGVSAPGDPLLGGGDGEG